MLQHKAVIHFEIKMLLCKLSAHQLFYPGVYSFRTCARLFEVQVLCFRVLIHLNNPKSYLQFVLLVFEIPIFQITIPFLYFIFMC